MRPKNVTKNQMQHSLPLKTDICLSTKAEQIQLIVLSSQVSLQGSGKSNHAEIINFARRWPRLPEHLQGRKLVLTPKDLAKIHLMPDTQHGRRDYIDTR